MGGGGLGWWVWKSGHQKRFGLKGGPSKKLEEKSDDDDNGGSKSSADEENENDDIDSGDRDELRVVILVFIYDEEAFERRAVTHSGRANNTIAINMPSVRTISVL